MPYWPVRTTLVVRAQRDGDPPGVAGDLHYRPGSFDEAPGR
ncbi:hypothetical protein [Micromonospora sp. WMMD1082]|nr:hypothetical protein [Micromonospora sp. WMMD1082]MDG4792537.1 hypothetical protein [Micromonospora sp. WMMD1082]